MYGGSGSTAPFIRSRDSRWGEWSSSRPCRLLPGKDTQCPLTPGGPQRRFGHFYYVCTAVLHTLVAGMLPSSQYPEGPATGHLGTGFSWFPCVYKRMLRWFPSFQVATARFSCSPPDLNFLDPYFIFMYMLYNHCHRATAHLQYIIIIIIIIIIIKPYSPSKVTH